MKNPFRQYVEYVIKKREEEEKEKKKLLRSIQLTINSILNYKFTCDVLHDYPPLPDGQEWHDGYELLTALDRKDQVDETIWRSYISHNEWVYKTSVFSCRIPLTGDADGEVILGEHRIKARFKKSIYATIQKNEWYNRYEFPSDLFFRASSEEFKLTDLREWKKEVDDLKRKAESKYNDLDTMEYEKETYKRKPSATHTEEIRCFACMHDGNRYYALEEEGRLHVVLSRCYLCEGKKTIYKKKPFCGCKTKSSYPYDVNKYIAPFL